MSSETHIFSYFADLEDPQTGNNVSHPLKNVITIAILAVICGADGWADVERYGKAKKEWLATFLNLETAIAKQIVNADADYRHSEGQFAQSENLQRVRKVQ